MKLRVPDFVGMYFDEEIQNEFENVKTDINCDNGYVKFELNDECLKVFATSYEDKGVRYIRLRWNEPTRYIDTKILGDTWERAYGNLQWQSVRPERIMPWYMIASNGTDSNPDNSNRFTECFGVGVRPNAMCMWQYDTEGVTLWLDLRNGGKGTLLGGREIECATVYFKEYKNISAYSSLKDFLKILSPDPYTTDHVVYGSNNWYYAYGKSSYEDIISDTKFVKEMCSECENIPYMVIDDGWQPNPCDAPWDRGNERFPDMKKLATEMKKIGTRPGIWVRYLVNGRDDEPRKMDNIPEAWYLQRNKNMLDPSHPEVLNYVKQTTERIVNWGYQLIKHDFSTFDIFGDDVLKPEASIGIWKSEGAGLITNGDWAFYDRTKTSAEIVKNFYKTIKDSAQGTVIIGCNCIGHLCAGYHQLNRTGDDTSGYEWSRTVRMGVNTLAFRLAQNNSFYGADADCVGFTGAIDWKYNKEWLKALSCSGTPLFVSCKPYILNEEQTAELKKAFKIASEQKDEMIPIDWMDTTTPTRYLINGKEVKFNWYSPRGNEILNPI